MTINSAFSAEIKSPYTALAEPLFAEQKIRQMLENLNKDFTDQESQAPQKGYLVTIETTPSFQVKLTPCGGPRVTKQLSGMPGDEAQYIENCPFCTYSENKRTDPRILQIFEDSFAVKSLNHQVLVITDEHYPHWFTIPLETQIALFQNILQIRNEHPNQVKKPIEFHCGSAAGQTVFHFHGRTGVYLN